MPRQPRVYVEGYPHHVIQRGEENGVRDTSEKVSLTPLFFYVVVYRGNERVVHTATVESVDPLTDAVTVRGLGGMQTAPRSNPVTPGLGGGWPGSKAIYLPQEIMMKKQVLVLIIFVSFFIACSSCQNGQVNEINQLNISFFKNDSDILTINIDNMTDTAISFYDSISPENNEIPYFIWVRKCVEDDIIDCENTKWVSPLKLFSSFVETPGKIISITPSGSVLKIVDCNSVYEMAGLKPPMSGELIQFKIHLYLDSLSDDFVEFRSEWMPTEQ